MNEYQVNSAFNDACSNGYMPIVKFITTSKELEFHGDSQTGLNVACANGHLEVVKYLLTSPDIENKPQLDNPQFGTNSPLIHACRKGHLDIVSYLLTSPDLKEHADIHANHGTPLEHAAMGGHLAVVKYLLNSPELKEHSDIHEGGDKAIWAAAAYEKVEVVKYLASSPELKDHANLHAQSDILFLSTISQQTPYVLNTLINELNIEKTPGIEQILENTKHFPLSLEATELFAIREMNQANQLKEGNKLKM